MSCLLNELRGSDTRTHSVGCQKGFSLLSLLNSGPLAFVKESFFIIFNTVSVELLN